MDHRAVPSATRTGRLVRLRYQKISGEARRLLREEGESGRFEFKQTPEAVKGDVLVAAANTVAIEQIPQGFVTILVGVGEREDPDTGVVTGEVLGLSTHADTEHRRRGIEKAKDKIQGRARATRPVPINITIIEEGVATKKPFLRVQVSPSYIPHHTQDGRRVTRYGASTRAIEGEELLDLYLLREAHQFEQRFRSVAAHLEMSLFDVASTVDSLGDDIQDRLGRIRQLASTAAEEAEDGRDFAEAALDAVGDVLTMGDFEQAMSALFDAVAMTSEGTWHALRQRRAEVWFIFSFAFECKKDSPTWQRTARRVHQLLDSEVALQDFLSNRAEIEEWRRQTLGGSPREWSARRWREAVSAVEQARLSGPETKLGGAPLEPS